MSTSGSRQDAVAAYVRARLAQKLRERAGSRRDAAAAYVRAQLAQKLRSHNYYGENEVDEDDGYEPPSPPSSSSSSSFRQPSSSSSSAYHARIYAEMVAATAALPTGPPSSSSSSSSPSAAAGLPSARRQSLMSQYLPPFKRRVDLRNRQIARQFVADLAAAKRQKKNEPGAGSRAFYNHVHRDGGPQDLPAAGLVYAAAVAQHRLNLMTERQQQQQQQQQQQRRRRHTAGSGGRPASPMTT